MLIIFIRTAVIFLTLMIIMRLMGKRQIGEMQPFEFIITLIIADLACIPMADVSIPLIYGIVAIFALFIMHQLIFLLEKLGKFPQKIISGRPSIVINKTGIDFAEMRKNNIDIEDLVQAMRSQGYFSFDDVYYAIFESNGKLSTLPNETAKKSPSIPIIAIENGKKVGDVLTRAKIDFSLIEKFLKEENCQIKQVEMLTLDSLGKVYFQRKNNPYKIAKIELPQGVKW